MPKFKNLFKVLSIFFVLLVSGSVVYGDHDGATSGSGSCAGYTQESCVAESGCGWDTTNGCYSSSSSGSGPCTGYTETSCLLEGGCAWDSATNFCSSTAGSNDYGVCGDYNDQSSCQAASNQCFWESTANYCYYDSGGGGGSCSAGFWWDSATNSCVVDCGSVNDQSICANYTECAWDASSNQCYYQSPGGGGGCYDYTSESECLANSDFCAWDNSGNSCYYGNGGSSGSGTCSSGLIWDSGVNSCTTDCPYYSSSESVCASYSDCIWDSSTDLCTFSSSGSGSGTPAVTIPAAPSGLTTTVDGRNVILAWSDNSGNEESFEIRRTDTGGTEQLINIVGENATAYTVFDAFGAYDYFVNACNTAGCSTSNTAFANIEVGGTTDDTTDDTTNIATTTPPTNTNITTHENDPDNQDVLAPGKTISGMVAYSDGGLVTDAYVDAWRPDTGIFVHTEVDTAGDYSLDAGEGLWEIWISPKSDSSDWVYNESNKTVQFAQDTSDETKTVNFIVGTANAEIKGRVLDPEGNAMPVNSLSLEVEGDGSRWFAGQPDGDGNFSIRLNEGIYKLFIHSQESQYIAPVIPEITVASGGTVDLGTLNFIRPAKVVTGTITRSDGGVVTDARVGAFNQSTDQWKDSQVDVSGQYRLNLTGGRWELSIDAISSDPDWFYNKPPSYVDFADDGSAENVTLDFEVNVAEGSISGRVILPDGSIPSRHSTSVSVRTESGFGGSGTGIDSLGAFKLAVGAGNYLLEIYTDNQQYSAPQLPLIVVTSGVDVDLGTIGLVQNNEQIIGQVTDTGGSALANIEVSAWQRTGIGHAQARTGSDGSYILQVGPGSWEVQAMPESSSQYYNSDHSVQTEVVPGIPSVVDFTLGSADARIEGSIVDNNGNLLTDVYGFVELSNEANFFGFGGVGGPVEAGGFGFAAPAGIYNLRLYVSPDSPYGAGSGQTVTLNEGQTVTTNLIVSQNSSTIIGKVVDENGISITGVKAHVFATSKGSTWREAQFDTSSGAYTLNVSSGVWYLGYDLVDDHVGYISSREPNIEVSVGEGETVTRDLRLRSAGASIAGFVRDPQGVGVQRAFVEVSKKSFGEHHDDNISDSTDFRDYFISGDETDSNGGFRVSVPAGEYFVKVFVNPERGYINSKEVKVNVANSETKNVDLALRSGELAILGKVFLDDRVVPNAFVSAWSKEGGYQQSQSRLDGSFRLNVNDESTWVLSAGFERDGVFYKSDELSVDVGRSDAEQDISLRRIKELPKSIVKTAEASKASVASVSGGASVEAPANSLSSSGSVDISIAPDTRVPSQGEIKVVGTAYDIEARDEAGQSVEEFESAVRVTIPYEETDLSTLGVTEDGLVLSFWGENTGKWEVLENSVVNKEENTVTASVDHFTRFAIVAAADITPPLAPVSVSASALANGDVILTWNNPAVDFSHSKVYRSKSAGVLGSIIIAEVTGTSYIDNTAQGGMTYYYTLHSVDPAGNESVNKDQVSVVAVGSSANLSQGDPVTLPSSIPTASYNFARNLKLGMSGEDVLNLQRLLNQHGLSIASSGPGSPGQETDYFGSLTEAAVIRFQDKYSEEILSSVGLSKGTGFVGVSTRNKLKTLGLTPGQISPPASIPYGPDVVWPPSSFSRDLTVGMSGLDVLALQQLLNSNGITISASGPGSPGQETDYFGSLTKDAVIRFQDKYAEEVLHPVGLTSGTGYVGASTRNKLKQIGSQ